ncbi:GTP-binding protein [Xylariaceae sp. FL1019]|nr:GTP-binding protein [Xylariaceae sp. FL1019]
MASIFTFEHEPPRVHSPWRSVHDATKRLQTDRSASSGASAESDKVSDTDVDRLEAEPQDGPIEYKLHLLLRPRRAYETMSTTQAPAGSQMGKGYKQTRTAKQTMALAASNTSREVRLQHLTTQLLWRLSQSSPHHTTAKRDLVIPKLPQDSDELALLQEPAKLLPGLEESNGALYEIGVADDGTFVGLTKEEMDESMNTLKVMSASLGCRVEVQRMKAVGTCTWTEVTDLPQVQTRQEDLWVAEALVVPILRGQGGDKANGKSSEDCETPRRGASTTEELRVSLIGPTSGKTTLLGTLANGTLDNGRGLSRINLLKHRHEVASGRTSSVAQELIGYHGQSILNYNADGITEWTDIHTCATGGRLVYLLDSAGHPRYHRTTLRALVGWAPHWTLLCIAANEEPISTAGTHSLTNADGAMGGIAAMDLAMAHLDLCLQLEMPLAILMTKVDLAVRRLLKDKLNRVLTRIKNTGRVPKLLTSATGPLCGDLSEIPDGDRSRCQVEIVDGITTAGDPLAVVPIILTSAVTGMGIGMIHALLNSLPVPPAPTAHDFTPQTLNPEQPASLFHIDEVFELSLNRARASTDRAHDSAPVITGYLRFGSLSIGDRVVLGPFPSEEEDQDARIPKDHPSPGYGLSIPHPSSAQFARLNARNGLSASQIEGEWRNATIVNIRALRLPVQTIGAGQSGSIQLVIDERTEAPSESDDSVKQSAPPPRIRKGQVVAMPSKHMIDTGLSLQASTGFKASFKTADIQSLAVGSLVNAYVGMVRAATRVCRVRKVRAEYDDRREAAENNDDVFGMSDHLELERTKSEEELDMSKTEYHVTLELLTNREWIELGARVVLLEGGIKDKSGGLEGFVGKVVEIVE